MYASIPSALPTATYCVPDQQTEFSWSFFGFVCSVKKLPNNACGVLNMNGTAAVVQAASDVRVKSCGGKFGCTRYNPVLNCSYFMSDRSASVNGLVNSYGAPSTAPS